MATKFTVKGVRNFKERKVFALALDILEDCVAASNEEPEAEFSVKMCYNHLEEGETNSCSLLTEGYSTQGVNVKQRVGATLVVELPWLACYMDLCLCFSILHAIKMVHRSARIMDADGKYFLMTDDDLERQWNRQCQNMDALLRKHEITTIAGVKRDFYVNPVRYKMMEAVADPVAEAFDDFVTLQWAMPDAVNLIEERRHVTEDEELSSVRVVDNSSSVFIGACRYVGMMKENTCKMVEFDEFCRLMSGRNEFQQMDACQALLSPIDEDEWLRLFDEAEGVRRENFRKTFIMRWNTDISNYQMWEFDEAIDEFEDEGFYYDWSIWDYQKVHVGDRFYMIRTGEGKHGVVMRGTIIGKPYPDEDWSGHGRKVYYIRMRLTNMIHPDLSPYLLTTDELSKYLPNFNWEDGHSGVMLDDSTAQLLEEIWHSHNSRVRGLAEKGLTGDDFSEFYKDRTL